MTREQEKAIEEFRQAFENLNRLNVEVWIVDTTARNFNDFDFEIYNDYRE